MADDNHVPGKSPQLAEDDEDTDWARHLTKPLRDHFEREGRYLVEQQVLYLRFRDPNKRKAAMVWLGRKRQRDFWYQIISWLFPAIIGVGAVLLANWLANRDEERANIVQLQQERTTLASVLRADVETIALLERNRRKELEPELKRLVGVSYPGGKGRPRRWLNAPVSTRFPIYEQNATRLGLLAPATVKTTTHFYKLAAELRSQTNLVNHPSLIVAGGPDKVDAVAAYRRAYEQFLQASKEALTHLAVRTMQAPKN